MKRYLTVLPLVVFFALALSLEGLAQSAQVAAAADSALVSEKAKKACCAGMKDKKCKAACLKGKKKASCASSFCKKKKHKAACSKMGKAGKKACCASGGEAAASCKHRKEASKEVSKEGANSESPLKEYR